MPSWHYLILSSATNLFQYHAQLLLSLPNPILLPAYSFAILLVTFPPNSKLCFNSDCGPLNCDTMWSHSWTPTLQGTEWPSLCCHDNRMLVSTQLLIIILTLYWSHRYITIYPPKKKKATVKHQHKHIKTMDCSNLQPACQEQQLLTTESAPE
jgi:hypothetical protein